MRNRDINPSSCCPQTQAFPPDCYARVTLCLTLHVLMLTEPGGTQLGELNKHCMMSNHHLFLLTSLQGIPVSQLDRMRPGTRSHIHRKVHFYLGPTFLT